jgi:hemolysin III
MKAGERLNTVTHVAGILMALAGAAFMHARAGAFADGWSGAGRAVFSAAAVLLFASSVACHSAPASGQRAWARLDHACIFVMIAASYTPFALAAPRHPENLLVLASIWLAAAGAALAAWRRDEPPAPWRYAVLGWASVAAAMPIALRAGAATSALLLAGAALYTAGTFFYRNPFGWRHAHGIWHLFVVAACGSHFAALLHAPLVGHGAGG